MCAATSAGGGELKSKLAVSVSVRPRFARSANLERDLERREPLDGYIVTSRALDVVERIAETAATGSAGGAWSLTGPYGSGKSSFALLIDAAFGDDSAIREVALRLIDESSGQVGAQIRSAHRRHGTENCGFHRGLVTAGREPLNRTVLWALYSAVLRSYDGIPSRKAFQASSALKGALADAESDDPRRTGPSPSALVDIARCLAEDAPLLLVIDEFGKNLEAIRDGGDADPYLLQQLTEAGQGSGVPIFLLTLQHMSFEDHLAGTSSVERREWAKVQGRFEDIAFVESASQTRALIGTVFDVQDASLRARINRWAKAEAKAMQELGIADLADPRTVASCYPLHPLAALVLPELCSRHGQHERTLFSFLTGQHRASASSFLDQADVPARGLLPTVGLDAVYDYFVDGSALQIESASVLGRWTEIATRLRDAHGLTPPQGRLAKAVALLNLVSTTGTFRASAAILARTGKGTDKTLAELERASIVTYRDFADEYRIWQGTDVDVNLLLDSARQRVGQRPLAEILSEIDQPQPVVAAKHSAKHDVLRVFKRRYANSNDQVEPLDAFSRFDGQVLLLVDSSGEVPVVSRPGAGAKPIVAAIPSDVSALDTAAREVASVHVALDDQSVVDDWVARREMSERLAQTRAALDGALTDAFSSDSCRWVLLVPEERELQGGRGTAALSNAADDVYDDTPRVRNEMLNRAELTSQGARARGLLLKAMIEYGTEPDLGMEGHGPEVAMYRAFLDRTGLHGPDKRNQSMAFHKPTDESLQPAWKMLRAEFKRSTRRRINLSDVHAALLSPPFGMKAGAIPVLVTAALIASADEVAIYEHGTFQPLLTPELSERMVRNPGHFDIKHFANTTGARRQVIEALASGLELQPSFRKHRVANVLTVVAHLVARISQLNNYTRQTHNLTLSTVRARDVLLAAVEPDELLFASLPEALGFPPMPARSKEYELAEAYAISVGEALDELSHCFEQLLDEQRRRLLEASAEPSRRAVVEQAASLVGEVLDPDVRAFVLSLANDTTESATDWIKAVATVVAKKAPAEWTDGDLLRFQGEFDEKFAAFHRLLALHHERRAHGNDPYDAYRVTVTRPDGVEQPLLVGVDQALRPHAERVLDEALTKLAEHAGSPRRAQHALLAVQGERLLPDPVAEHGTSNAIDMLDREVGRG